ncbi:MAG TPA: TonB-dependent receptor [Rhizomicrobium sp.]|jgi:outer membrane receptor protein involved in Fe transport
MPHPKTLFVLLACAACGIAPAYAQDQAVEDVLVIGTRPADTGTIDAATVDASHAITATDLLNENLSSVFLSDTESSPFQEDLYYRGYDASPVLGTAVGIAIYQNGTRINQRFGDTVLWDTMPSFAISHVDVLPGSDPVFGLNALGGAIVFDMKTGFDMPEGLQMDAAGGSYGRARLVLQGAEQDGNQAWYMGLSVTDDSGWRRDSSGQVYQAYGDYSAKTARASFGVSVTLASDFLNENGAVPVQDSRLAPFAIPDTARDNDALVQLRGTYDFDAGLTLRDTAYLRGTHVRTANGEASDFDACDDNPAILCDDDGDALMDQAGKPISSSIDAEGTIGLETVSTTALGDTLELDATGTLAGRHNALVIGNALDYAYTGFGSTTALGTLSVLDGGSTAHALGIFLGGTDWNVRLGTTMVDEGVYAQDTLELTPALTLEAAARAHFDSIDLSDRYGTADTGDHNYDGFNPSVELAWRPDESTSLYIEAEQSSRTPTPAELSCADPTQPCLFPLSFISDPALKQVVARTIEMGANGKMALGNIALGWSGNVFATRNDDDIIFESSGPFIGSGFFANVGPTQRVGGEIEADGTWDKFHARASYAYVRATFESAFTESSPDNPGTDANGNIFVRAGDRMPNIPLSTAKFDLSYAATPDLDLLVEAMAESSQYLRGDEANLQSPLSGYAVLNLEADYRICPALQLYVRGDNVLDSRYATFGLYGDPTSNGIFPQFSNPRFIVPAEPLAFWAGVRARI